MFSRSQVPSMGARKAVGSYTSGPRIEPYGVAGFQVRYADATHETVALVREYQLYLRQDCPGWLSRLEYRSASGEVVLYVFPVSEMPAMVFAGTTRGGYGKEDR